MHKHNDGDKEPNEDGVKQPKKGSVWVVLGVVLLGVIFAIGWQVLLLRSELGEGIALRARLQALEEQFAVLQMRVHNQQMRLEAAHGAFERLEDGVHRVAGFDERMRVLDQRIEQISERLAASERALQRFEEGRSVLQLSEIRWQLEARELLAFAEQQLMLGRVLEAHETLAAVARYCAVLPASAALFRFQELLAADRARLQSVVLTPRQELLEKLGELAVWLRQAPLAFASEVALPQPDVKEGLELRWYEKLWQELLRLGAALGQDWRDILRIERIEGPTAPLAPQQQQAVMLLLEFSIATARHALLLGDEALFRSALEHITALERFFDGRAEAVVRSKALLDFLQQAVWVVPKEVIRFSAAAFLDEELARQRRTAPGALP